MKNYTFEQENPLINTWAHELKVRPPLGTKKPISALHSGFPEGTALSLLKEDREEIPLEKKQ